MARLKTITEAIEETNQYVKDRMTGKITSLKTGFRKLDSCMIDGIEWNSTITLGGRPSVGKCLGKGTKVIMFDGRLKVVEDVKVGDLLMGPDSKPRKVLSTTKGKDIMYIVNQLRGISYRVNSEHIISLKRGKTDKKQIYGKISNVSIKDYVKFPEGKKQRWKGYIPEGIELPEVKLDIDPYFIGLWLGDGSTAKPQITTADIEIIDYLNIFSKENNLKINKDGKYGYSFSQENGSKIRGNYLLNILKDEKLLNNKHIPKKYILNSRKNRLKLLAGLIDSDGHILKSSTIEITLKQEDIIKDIAYICQSLGFRTSINNKQGSFTKPDGSKFIGNYFRITISGNLSCIPIIIKRKKDRLRNSSRNTTMTRIKVVIDKYDDYYGFSLDGDHLFLLEDFTVTHNSTVSDCIVDGAFDNNLVNGQPDFDLLDFNWELSSRVTLLRRISAKFKKSYKYIISADNNKITPEELKEIETILKDRYGRLPITYCEEPLTVKEFGDTVKKFCDSRKGRKVLVRIDHTLLARMSASDGGQVQMLLNLLLEANAIKKTYPVIFLFLTQINREFEQRQEDGTDKSFPLQGDVYGGDAAAMFSETILLLNRPAKYGIKIYGNRNSDKSVKVDSDDLFMHIVKNRNSSGDQILHYKENFKHMSIIEY